MEQWAGSSGQAERRGEWEKEHGKQHRVATSQTKRHWRCPETNVSFSRKLYRNTRTGLEPGNLGNGREAKASYSSRQEAICPEWRAQQLGS